MSAPTYPVRVDATLDPGLSRWLWLLKWLLALPHYVILFFLWIAFIVVSIVAFFAILVTGRYPRSLFEFNVGVLRWTWRVAYYAYGALGTDRYPPFSLAEDPTYPAHFEVAYPEHLSRGLVLVKWWLLAIPHYLVIGIFLGGGTWAAWRATDTAAGPGLITLLVLIAALALAFTGQYPLQIFDFVLGMNRWALRVAAYAGLMTDTYPPFRLDMGGHEPAGTLIVPPPTEAGPAEAPPPPTRRGWTLWRVITLVTGSIVTLVALGLLAAGGVATWATNSQRDAAGYLTSGSRSFATSGYAVTSDQIDLSGASGSITPSSLLGSVRVQATPTRPAQPVFIGVAPTDSVNSYLSGVDHMTVTNWSNGDTTARTLTGAAPRTIPPLAGIWTAQVTGTGQQALTWRPSSGQWTVVVMNAGGRPGVSTTAEVGATLPDLAWIAVGLFAVGGVLLIAGVVMIVVPAVRAAR